MNIYFACASLSGGYESALRENGAKNLLVSYAFKQAVPKVAEYVKSVEGGRLIIDSGAFSAWNKGEVIDLKEYGEWCGETLEKLKGEMDVHIVNLDVIPGKLGQNPTQNEINDSAERGWENLLKLEEMGLKPLHVFHQFEDFSVLDRIRDHQSYFGVSPSNACSVSERERWLAKVFYYLKDDLPKTHGFGVTSKRLLESFPWYSVDSTSWAAVEMYGRACFTTKRDRHGDWFNSRKKSHRRFVLGKEVKELIRVENLVTNLWELRGVKWRDDAN